MTKINIRNDLYTLLCCTRAIEKSRKLTLSPHLFVSYFFDNIKFIADAISECVVFIQENTQLVDRPEYVYLILVVLNSFCSLLESATHSTDRLAKMMVDKKEILEAYLVHCREHEDYLHSVLKNSDLQEEEIRTLVSPSEYEMLFKTS